MSFDGKQNPAEYLIDQIARFHDDPPDNDYQDGYFDALAYMADYFDIIKIGQPDAPVPSRPRLVLIKGGLDT